MTGVASFLNLRPVLLVAFCVLVLWLAVRVLREALVGRVGQLGKLLLFGAAFGFYALTVVLTAMGGEGAPWRSWLALPRLSVGTLVIVALVVVGWLILRETPFPMPWWLGFILASPVRRLLAPPEAVVQRLAVGPGMRVVEVGCGTGVLTCAAARRILPGGELLAVDIQPQMIVRTERRAAGIGLQNVRTFAASADRLPFDIYDADLVLFVQVLGEIRDRIAALKEAMRVLKPGGVLAISEAVIDPHYRSRNDVRRLARHAGFEPLAIEGSLFNYTALFRKPAPKEPLGYVPRFG